MKIRGFGPRGRSDLIVEVRTYRVKPGLRDRFLDFFEREAVPLQRSFGMRVVGPFLDVEDPDTFIWLRAFPSHDERERMKRALYEGAKWKGELEAIAMPMLESYSFTLTELAPGFVNDLHEGGTGMGSPERASPLDRRAQDATEPSQRM